MILILLCNQNNFENNDIEKILGICRYNTFEFDCDVSILYRKYLDLYDNSNADNNDNIYDYLIHYINLLFDSDSTHSDKNLFYQLSKQQFKNFFDFLLKGIKNDKNNINHKLSCFSELGIHHIDFQKNIKNQICCELYDLLLFIDNFLENNVSAKIELTNNFKKERELKKDYLTIMKNIKTNILSEKYSKDQNNTIKYFFYSIMKKIFYNANIGEK